MLRCTKLTITGLVAAAVSALLLSPDEALAKNKKRRKTKTAFLDAGKAGPDFLIQGEYLGKSTNGKRVGAQIIARGDGKFDVVFLTGGLPGAGWDGKTNIKAKAERDGSKTRIHGKSIEGVITKKGVLEARSEQLGTLRLEQVHRKSPTLGAEPPKNALVLFDGTNVKQWENGNIVEGKLLAVGTRTTKKFKDFTLHLEFRTPFMPYAKGQARGNSGMYLLDQYECQVLDSFGLQGKDNECGGIYKVARPKVNMCLPPLSWQTYDVEFRAARFDEDGKKVKDAVVTIKHNGVLIHDKLQLPKPTPGGHQRDEKPGRLYLQNHGDPVRFRNIWIVEH